MKRVSAFVIMSILCAAPAHAVETIPWKDVGGWSVLLDPSLGNACFVSTVYEGGTTLRLGFDFSNAQRSIYLALGNPNWKSLEPGKDYPLKIQFDGNPLWDATARALTFSGTNFLSVVTSDPNFADEFSRKLAMRATFNGKQVAALRLKGSARAIDEMINCQKAVDKALSAQKPPEVPKGPFQATPDVRNATDPFEL
ncbi:MULTISPECIES: hypothetical protein [unclassified Sinorhizobium]|uniref:hypothetical protein n=1 Tax=unclassified Sinorhizobium TaxID=2613772 RepID=UPI0035269760